MPDYETLMRPVLEGFAAGEGGIKDLLPGLAVRFGLSDEEVGELLPSGRTTVLASRAHWARTYMGRAGLLQSPKRGRHRITEKGLALLREHQGPIDNRVLARFDGFETWRRSATVAPSDRHEGESNPTAPSALSESLQDASSTPEAADPLRAETTPAEIIATAHAELMNATAAELLDLVRGMDPARFEQLIVDLLIAMGYGGGKRTMGRRLGRSGDGGIDGVIDEDALGLDAVYIQAKRYAAANTVGSPAVREFIGSLVDRGATKGVFVTTSAFTKEAADLAARVAQRIVLIDGPRLARLLFDHEVGVRTRETYPVKTVDEDYFADPEG